MILSLKKIKKSFGSTIALKEVDFTLKKGEIHALIGENGAGKSTLMNILSGSVRADGGDIEINGKPYLPSHPLDARRHGLALIHQELSLMPHLSVAENILMGMERSKFLMLDRDDLLKRASEVLNNFQHGNLDSETLVKDLPIASRQVVEICRAVAAKAEIILMDEPTSSLHNDDVKKFFDLIFKLKENGVSIIYISHFLEEIREICDTFTVLRDGQNVASGNVKEVDDDYLISKMVGRSVENLFPIRDRKIGENILTVRDLSAPPAVEHASFNLKRGEILGIAGLMGSGRTALIKVLYGLEQAESGIVEVDGKRLKIKSITPAQRLDLGFGYVSEDRKAEGLAIPLSIADNITLTRFSACSKFGWLNLQRQNEIAKMIASKIGVKNRTPTQAVSTLSGGNQQKVAIGRLIHQDADILLLDEPTRGIDIGSKAQIYEIIGNLAAAGKAIILVSSYLPELFGMCDRLVVMSYGRLSVTRDISEWTPESVINTAIGQNPIDETTKE